MRTVETGARGFKVRARLIGANLRLRRYEIEDLESGVRYSGRVLPEALPSLYSAVLDSTYAAPLREVTEEFALTHEVSVKTVLVELTQG